MSARPTTDDLAGLSAEAYNTYPRERWEEGVVVNGTRYEIIDQTSGISGYQGTLFRNTETGAFVVAHRGTEFDRQPVRDAVAADGGMVLTGVNSQAGAAVAFTERAIAIAHQRNAVDGCDVPGVYVTGHSLGGTLAQTTAHRFGLPAETFDAYGAAGLVADMPGANPNVVNHVRASSFVSAASEHVGEVRIYTTPEDVAAMQRHGYANDDRRWTDLRNPTGVALGIGVEAHYMRNFLSSNDGGSIINAENLARTEQYRPMVEKYRADIAGMHDTLALPRNTVDGVVDGVGYLGGKIAEGARYVLGIEREPPPAPPGFNPPTQCPNSSAGDALRGAEAPINTMYEQLGNAAQRGDLRGFNAIVEQYKASDGYADLLLQASRYGEKQDVAQNLSQPFQPQPAPTLPMPEIPPPQAQEPSQSRMSR